MNFLNRLRLDRIRVMSLWPHFLAHPVQVALSDLLTPVADVPARSALRASSSGSFVVPRTRRRIGDWALSCSRTASVDWNSYRRN